MGFKTLFLHLLFIAIGSVAAAENENKATKIVSDFEHSQMTEADATLLKTALSTLSSEEKIQAGNLLIDLKENPKIYYNISKILIEFGSDFVGLAPRLIENIRSDKQIFTSAYILSNWPELPKDQIEDLFKILEDSPEAFTKACAGTALKSAHSQSDRVVSAILKYIEDPAVWGDPLEQYFQMVYSTLDELIPLSTNGTASLIELYKKTKDSRVQKFALTTLGRTASAPTIAVPFLLDEIKKGKSKNQGRLPFLYFALAYYTEIDTAAAAAYEKDLSETTYRFLRPPCIEASLSKTPRIQKKAAEQLVKMLPVVYDFEQIGNALKNNPFRDEHLETLLAYAENKNLPLLRKNEVFEALTRAKLNSKQAARISAVLQAVLNSIGDDQPTNEFSTAFHLAYSMPEVCRQVASELWKKLQVSIQKQTYQSQMTPELPPYSEFIGTLLGVDEVRNFIFSDLKNPDLELRFWAAVSLMKMYSKMINPPSRDEFVPPLAWGLYQPDEKLQKLAIGALGENHQNRPEDFKKILELMLTDPFASVRTTAEKNLTRSVYENNFDAAGPVAAVFYQNEQDQKNKLKLLRILSDAGQTAKDAGPSLFEEFLKTSADTINKEVLATLTAVHGWTTDQMAHFLDAPATQTEQPDVKREIIEGARQSFKDDELRKADHEFRQRIIGNTVEIADSTLCNDVCKLAAFSSEWKEPTQSRYQGARFYNVAIHSLRILFLLKAAPICPIAEQSVQNFLNHWKKAKGPAEDVPSFKENSQIFDYIKLVDIALTDTGPLHTSEGIYLKQFLKIFWDALEESPYIDETLRQISAHLKEQLVISIARDLEDYSFSTQAWGSIFNIYGGASTLIAFSDSNIPVLEKRRADFETLANGLIQKNTPLNVPYSQAPGFVSSSRSAAGRAIPFYGALSTADSKYFPQLFEALKNFNSDQAIPYFRYHAEGISIPTVEPGKNTPHVGPDGIAPYYFLTTFPYATAYLKKLLENPIPNTDPEELENIFNDLKIAARSMLQKDGSSVREGYTEDAAYADSFLGLTILPFIKSCSVTGKTIEFSSHGILNF